VLRTFLKYTISASTLVTIVPITLLFIFWFFVGLAVLPSSNFLEVLVLIGSFLLSIFGLLSYWWLFVNFNKISIDKISTKIKCGLFAGIIMSFSQFINSFLYHGDIAALLNNFKAIDFFIYIPVIIIPVMLVYLGLCNKAP